MADLAALRAARPAPGLSGAGMPNLWLPRLLGALVAIALAGLPLGLGRYGTGVVTEILIFAIFAMSLDLLIGYTGLVSFGHAAYFGFSTYVVMLLGVHGGVDQLTGMAVAVVATAALAAAVGYFCTRTSGVAFLMITMAVSQLLYSVAVKWRPVTGGSDGIGGLIAPEIGPVDFGDPTVVYYVTAAGFVLSYALLRRITRSPAGRILVGIRENETRMRAIGVPVHAYKTLAFTVAGAFAGLAGALYSLYAGFVSADILLWTRSGEGLVMVVLGGVGTLVGPALGAAIFLTAKNLISSHTEHWLLIVGAIFVGCVLFARNGVWGSLVRAGRGGRP